jgi:hypothetical protein
MGYKFASVTFTQRDFGTIGARFGILVCAPSEAVKVLEGRP